MTQSCHLVVCITGNSCKCFDETEVGAVSGQDSHHTDSISEVSGVSDDI